MRDFEFARDRIMMGIERKKLSISDKERFDTALHEAGHTVVCYYTPHAKKLYKATIVARGDSLGAVRHSTILKCFRRSQFQMKLTCSSLQRIRCSRILT